jgi:hypothetical protein
VSGEGERLTPHAYALALTLCHEDAAPLPVRVAWASFLRRFEMCPHMVREAALKAHIEGHMKGGRLTQEGAALALQALSGAGLPPPSIDGPHSGAGGEA